MHDVRCSRFLALALPARSIMLVVNRNKCQVIIVGNTRSISQLDLATLLPLAYDGMIIPYSVSIKDLKLYIDTTLSWRKQVVSVCQKVTGSLRALHISSLQNSN